jgi:hypothetical protein
MPSYSLLQRFSFSFLNLPCIDFDCCRYMKCSIIAPRLSMISETGLPFAPCGQIDCNRASKSGNSAGRRDGLAGLGVANTRPRLVILTVSPASIHLEIRENKGNAGTA